ncbi:MAG: hypothetical protein HPM95_08370 [Alphaproteobacteria bacterium]|nr:hypothetical protein [Alphaproteobacteria bacterium]
MWITIPRLLSSLTAAVLHAAWNLMVKTGSDRVPIPARVAIAHTVAAVVLDVNDRFWPSGGRGECFGVGSAGQSGEPGKLTLPKAHAL